MRSSRIDHQPGLDVIMHAATLFTTAIVAATAGAQPTFIVTKGTSMFRVTDGGTDAFELDDSLHSLAMDDDGALIGGSGTPDGSFELYELTDPFGPAPALSQIGTTAERVPTLSNIQGTLYGFQQDPGDDDADLLFSFDGDLDQNFVGNLGIDNGIGGSAYDPISDSFWVSDHIANVLYDVDYTDATINDTVSVDYDFEFHGGEFHDGAFWAAVVDVADDELVIGTFDVGTGEFVEQMLVAEDVSQIGGTVSFFAVPAPGAVALLGLGGLAATRRRR